MAIGCVLKLTSGDNPIDIDGRFKSFRPIETLKGIPRDNEALTLYIVGHALPDELIDAAGNEIPETELAPQIRSARDGKPTLIIWDVCYAKTFQTIEGVEFDSWPRDYVHIFSCQAHERTWVGTSKSVWRNGPKDGPRISYFSQKLAAALPHHQSWKELQKDLRRQFGVLQTPEIVDHCGYSIGQFRVS